MPLSPETLINNRYRIISILGQGGMGYVYHAEDMVLNVSVAVKENLFLSEEYARQFEREAKILAGLRHPSLPKVGDYFVIPGQGLKESSLICIHIFSVNKILKIQIDRLTGPPITLHQFLSGLARMVFAKDDSETFGN